MKERFGRQRQAASVGRVAQAGSPAGSRRFPLVAAVAMIGTMLFAGCAHTPGAGDGGAAGAVEPASREKSSPSETGTRFEVASNIEGRVVSVRKDLRYVIVDFSFSRLPEPGATMALMRDGERVGKVRITTRSSQARGGAVVADIKEGEARAGDLVSGDL